MDLNILKEEFKKYLEFKKSENYDEKYKFDFFNNNQIDFSKSINFVDDFKKIRSSAMNLTPQNLRNNLLIHLWDNHKNIFKNILNDLYNEEINIKDRINNFEETIFKIIKDDKDWEAKWFWKLWFWSTSYLLALKNYKKYLFINPVWPFNYFMKKYNLDEKLYKKSNNWERYENWNKLANEIIIPSLKSLKKDTEMIDIQDFIFCMYWWYWEIEKNSKDWEKNISYWLFSPWENAIKWDEFYKNWIIAIWWDELWDLNKYKNKEEIKNKMIEITWKKNPYNDINACEDFVRNIKKWDIIIPKKWTQYYLWYGIVEWWYEFDESENNYKSKIKVNWIKKWIWEEIDWPIVMKTLTNIDKYNYYVKKLINLLWINSNMKNEISKLLDIKKQIILYWPPGTWKTYNIKNIIENHSWEEYNSLKNSWRLEFITFHQSFSYEEFIEWIKPSVELDGENIIYGIEDWIFKRISKKANELEKNNFEEAYRKLLKIIEENDWILNLKTKKLKDFFISINSNWNLNLHTWIEKNKQWVFTKEKIKLDLENNKQFFWWESYIDSIKDYLIKNCFYNSKKEEIKNHYLIIDEINRGNISKIFGELITLLESDKRLWEENEITTKLPYSKEIFWIPSNLFIIATMNTSDKSIVSLDTALRRRFWFLEMLPDYSLEELKENIEWINLWILLKKLNDRIEYLLDKDHLIWHSYFTKVKSLEDLKFTIYNEIYPLLEEYFYWENEKIRLTLWIDLFEKKLINKNLFEKSDIIETEEYLYEINKNLSDEDFILAIKNIIKNND